MDALEMNFDVKFELNFQYQIKIVKNFWIKKSSGFLKNDVNPISILKI